MRFESLPDIPHPENPEHELLMNAAETEVTEKVAALEAGLDLSRHPKLRARLAELGSHFGDSLMMASIIRDIYPDLKAAAGLPEDKPERLMRAALVHDVGKSGPSGEETDFHFAVRRLFRTPSRQFNPFIDGRLKTIREFVQEQDLPKAEKVLADLRTGGIDPDKEPMIDFWRRHAQWSYDILAGDTGPDLDADLVKAAASHHLLENQNPAHLETAEVPTEAHVLEVLEMAELLAAVDKYQAFRSRGGLEHGTALERLKKTVEAKPDLPVALRQKFLAVIETLNRSEKALAKFFEKSQ